MNFYEEMIAQGVKPLKKRVDYVEWVGCKKKRGYPTENQAKIAMIRGHYGDPNIHTYKCDKCGHWHLGH